MVDWDGKYLVGWGVAHCDFFWMCTDDRRLLYELDSTPRNSDADLCFHQIIQTSQTLEIVL